MKRDMDIIRNILLSIEQSDHDVRTWMTKILPDVDQDQVSYNIQLMHEKGLIEAINLSSSSGYLWLPKRITYEGHDLLDTIRDPEIWGKTKNGVKLAGGFTIEIIKSLAKGYIKKKIETTTGINIDI